MEPQVDICFKKDKKGKCCIDLVIFIIAILIGFVAGLLIGNLTELVTFLGTGAIVLFLATLLIFIIVRVIMLICNKNKCCK